MINIIHDKKEYILKIGEREVIKTKNYKRILRETRDLLIEHDRRLKGGLVR